MTACWKALDHSLNNCEVLTQCTYTTSNLKNLRNCLEENQYIDYDSCNHKNQHPCHDHAWACRRSKPTFLVCIRLTGNFQSHPRKRFRINELWSNKYDTHRSTIKKIGLEQKTWSWFHIKHTKNPKNIIDE